MTLEFKMPKLGESVTEGTIGRWLKQPGDVLEQYEPMLEVTTDKVDTEVSSPINGKLVEIVVPEGETVAVGAIIARLDEGNGVDASAVHDSQNAAVDSQPALSGTESAEASAPAKASYVSPVVARLAAEHAVDLTQVKGTGAGGRVTKKDIDSFVASRKLGQSQPVARQTTHAVAEARTTADPQPPTPVEESQLQQTMEAGPRNVEEERAPAAMPAAPQPPATGTQRPAPAIEPDDELVPLSPMRRAIAEHMVRSKRTAPHVTTVMEADLSRMMAHRERNKADFERQGVKLTFTPYFVQAVVAGLQATPIVNAGFSDDGIVMHQRLNIGVAVAIPDGLIVPVIKDADDKSLLGLARAVNDLAERARTRRLQPDDTQGGTFTITNHGVSGSLFAMPIIPQPQSAILGVGAIQKRAVVISENGLDAIAIRPMCYLSLTFDHRLIDGATADEFLGAIKRALESYG